MQLNANFVVLATALAYGSTSILALPVGSTFTARDVVDVFYDARDFPEPRLDARNFFGYEDGLEVRGDAAKTPVGNTGSMDFDYCSQGICQHVHINSDSKDNRIVVQPGGGIAVVRQ